MDVVAGFTTESITHLLGGTYRGGYRPLNDGIIAGRIRGVVGVVGCDSPKQVQDQGHLDTVYELLRNDVLVAQTGCSAIACGKAGLLRPEAAFEHAGRGLQEICEAVGIPPVLHVGSCVDNSRILTVAMEMVREGGIGRDFSELPIAAAAPGWWSEKAITIGFYAVASGITTVLGSQFNILGSEAVTRFVRRDRERPPGSPSNGPAPGGRADRGAPRPEAGAQLRPMMCDALPTIALHRPETRTRPTERETMSKIIAAAAIRERTTLSAGGDQAGRGDGIEGGATRLSSPTPRSICSSGDDGHRGEDRRGRPRAATSPEPAPAVPTDRGGCLPGRRPRRRGRGPHRRGDHRGPALHQRRAAQRIYLGF
jgi:hypothetical protein